MAAGLTVSLTGDWMVNIGNRRQTQGTGNLGTSYATGGQAVTAAQLGLGVIQSLVVDPAGGLVFEYVASTGKVKAYRRDSHSHTLFLNNADVVDGATTRINAGTNLLGANTGTDISVAGVPDTTLGGGIVNAAQAALAEVSNAVDLSGTTFNFRAIGY